MEIKTIPVDLPEEGKRILRETIHILNIESIKDWIKIVNEGYERNQQDIRLKSITIDSSAVST